MSLSADEADLIAAQRLRDMARAIVRTDLATLRESLAAEPLSRRLRNRVVAIAADTAQGGIDLALENRALLGFTLAGLFGWLFRKPIGGLAHSGWMWFERWRIRRR